MILVRECAHNRAGKNTLAEEHSEGIVHRIKAWHPKVENRAVTFDQFNRQRNCRRLAGRFDHDINHCAAGKFIDSSNRVSCGIVNGIGGTIMFGNGQPMTLQINRDHPLCPQPPYHIVPPQSRRTLPNHCHILGDQTGRQMFRGIDNRPQLLGLQQVRTRRCVVQGQQVINRNQRILRHPLVTTHEGQR